MMNLKSKLFFSDIWLCFLAALFFSSSCSSSKWIVPPEYIGEWETGMGKITVRTKLKHEPFHYTSGIAAARIRMNNDKTVTGQIGLAEFTNARLKRNPGLPWETGVEYIIECGRIGKIFENDPLDLKEVEIWFSPINLQGGSNSSLRYTEGLAQFPMARLLFRKVKN